MSPREELLKGVENREEIAKVIDKAEQAIKTWEMTVTDFLSPAVLAEVERVFQRLTDVSMQKWGGYPQAERQRLGIARVDLPWTVTDIPLSALDIAGNFLFDTANHRDFLGAMLKVGDIIVLGERGAQAIVVPELADFLCANLLQVRSVPVKTSPIPLTELKVRPPQKKEINTVEASLRLDAIASAGFGISRSKMAEAISAGDVRVNWKDISQSSYNVKTGDLISFRGKGRLEVGEVTVTKKERYRVHLTRFI